MNIVIDNEFKALIPPLSPDEYNQLEANLLKEGCRDPLVLWGDTLIDGHNRYEICERHGLVFGAVQSNVINRNDAILWIIRNQMGRRNLSPFARAELALKLESTIKEKAKERQATSTGGVNPQLLQIFAKAEAIDTRSILAKESGLSHTTVDKVRAIVDKAPENIKQSLRDGKITISKVFSDIKREERIAQKQIDINTITQNKNTLVLNSPVSVILADPPWRYDFTETDNRRIENQYPTTTTEDIYNHLNTFNVPIANNCVLYLWSTAPKLIEALEVMKAWGFTYKTQAVWDKQRTGMGYWFRGRHEILLVGTRGNPSPPPPEDRFESVFVEQRSSTHSEKPECVYAAIEKMYPVSVKAEIYARKKRNGWFVFGNEV